MADKDEPTSLAVHVGELRAEQRQLKEKVTQQEQWQRTAQQKLEEQQRQFESLPDRVAERLAADDDPQTPTSGTGTNASTTDPTAQSNSDNSGSGTASPVNGEVQPPPSVPNPADQPRHDPQAPPTKNGPGEPPNSPPPAKRSLLDRLR